MVQSSESKIREWRRRLHRFEKTELTVAEFCKREGVSAPSLYQWRKRLAKQPQAPTKATDGRPSSFTPVRVVGTTSIVAQLPGGTTLQIPADNAAIVQAALQALASADRQQAARSAS